MTNEKPAATNPAFFAAVFNQNWENVRHVKNERISFMNAYSLINAGVLTLLQNVHSSDLIRLVLLFFMILFSAFGFLTSLRLKAELEESLDKIRAISMATEVGEFVALGQLEGKPSHYPRFRWLFPVFYMMTTAGFITLLLYRLITGQLAG
jgi:hypothetical protein